MQMVSLGLSVPADGVKGKTWGPSTLHQRERGHLPLRPPLAPRPGGVWSKSAPNLDKARGALARPHHEIGNDSSVRKPPLNINTNNNSNANNKNNSTTCSTLRLFKNKVTAIGYNALGLDLVRPFRLGSSRNNSFPANPTDTLTPPSRRVALSTANKQNRLSRSSGNLHESHYDTVFTTNSFVIATGRDPIRTPTDDESVASFTDDEGQTLLNKSN